MSVKAFRPELAVERLDEAIVGRLTKPREIQGDIVGMGRQIEVTADELTAMSTMIVLGISGLPADAFQCLDDVLDSIGEASVGCRTVARVRVDYGPDPQLLACRELVVNEVHRPDVVRSDRFLAIVSELFLHPALGMRVASLKT